MLKIISILCFSLFQTYAHEEKLQDIEVIESEVTQGLVDFVPSVKKLKGQELNRKRQTSIGDTIGSEAGVQSTTFGPNASRPVIRGLDGDRVRVLQNSLGTLDASTQSVDHAIPVDTLTIDQIEIVRGPMALLYGSSAVGGVVNLVTNRIHYDYEEGFFSKFLSQGETVNNGLSNALHLNYGVKNWMLHFDGSTRNLGDVEVPVKEKLENSYNKQNNSAFAVSKIMDRGYLGVSFNHFNTLYGVVADEEVSIDMTQNRFELHSEYRPESGKIRKWRLKAASSDYFHKELEGEEIGTTFKNKGNEARIEALNKSSNWDGMSGLQTQFFDFSAKGEEAFIPSSETSKIALFTFQQLSFGANALRFGARLENFLIEKKSSDKFGSSDEKNYMGYNASIGHCYDFSLKNTFETSLSYTERAPNFQELFANGNHVATGTFEEGNSKLIKEKSYAIEATYKKKTDRIDFIGSIYSQVFKDYISLTSEKDENHKFHGVDGDFPPYFYQQVDALFYGIDIENKFQLSKLSNGILSLINKLDYVRAKNTDEGTNLPRISPFRLSAGIELDSDSWLFDLETMYVAHQTKVDPLETTTKDYIYTNLGVSYKIINPSSAIDLFFKLRNVFDVEARNHVSVLKEIAPLPGRNFILGVQAQL